MSALAPPLSSISASAISTTVESAVRWWMSRSSRSVVFDCNAPTMLGSLISSAALGLLLLSTICVATQLLRRRCSHSPDEPAASTRLRAKESLLLASREFVRDIAWLAEHIVMSDIPDDFWNDASSSTAPLLQKRLNSREEAPFFAPDKVGDVVARSFDEADQCAVRWQRALWTIKFKERYSPCVADFIDTAVGTEKPAVVLLLRPSSQPPIIAVAFRGSKTMQDYFLTDISPKFVPLPLGALAAKVLAAKVTDGAAALPPPRSAPSPEGPEIDANDARLMALLSETDAPPCATLGLWRAYAGEHADTLDGDTPRARVRRAVERLLTDYPEARLVLTGHSLGGALATLCAFDLLGHSDIVRDALCPLTLVAFAAPRMFNQAFQEVMSEVESEGALHAMRVVVGSDLIARVPPRQLGGHHGVRARLLLHPPLGRATLTSDDPDDKELWRIGPADTHICHALYLGGETTSTHGLTVPMSPKSPWPYPPNQQGSERLASIISDDPLDSLRKELKLLAKHASQPAKASEGEAATIRSRSRTKTVPEIRRFERPSADEGPSFGPGVVPGTIDLRSIDK
jgi:hypothetical protein